MAAIKSQRKKWAIRGTQSPRWTFTKWMERLPAKEIRSLHNFFSSSDLRTLALWSTKCTKFELILYSLLCYADDFAPLVFTLICAENFVDLCIEAVTCISNINVMLSVLHCF